MKLSVESYTLSNKFGDDRMPAMLKAAGFDAVDYSFYTSSAVRERSLGDGYREYARELRKRLDDAGLVCNQSHAPYSINRDNRFDTSDPEYLALTRSIEAAAILGARSIIVHTLAVEKGTDVIEFNAGFYSTLIPYCESFGIKISVENLFEQDPKRKYLVGRLGSPAEINAMLDRLDSPCFDACLDIGHAAITGWEPEDFIRNLKPGCLKALHVHDNDYIRDLHKLPFTDRHDRIHWDLVCEALRDTGYDGDFTFEIISYLERVPADLMPQALSYAAAVGRKLIAMCGE